MRLELDPDRLVWPAVDAFLEIALEIEALYLRRAGAHQRETTLVECVDELLRRGRSFDQDAEPPERVRAGVLLAPGNGVAGGPEEAVRPDHVVADQLFLLRGSVEADPPGREVELRAAAKAGLRARGIQVVHTHRRGLEDYGAARLQAGSVEVLDHLLLAVDHDLAPAGEVGEVDAVADPAEAQLDPVVDRPLPVHSLPHARLAQELRGGVLQHPGPDGGLDLLAASELEHHRFYALQVQEVREQRRRWPASHDPYLCAHRYPVPSLSVRLRLGGLGAPATRSTR